jgi:hypothetical protein
MGKASRRRRRESDSVLREVGKVYLVGPDGQELELEGSEAERFRSLMTAHCAICAEGGSHESGL